MSVISLNTLTKNKIIMNDEITTLFSFNQFTFNKNLEGISFEDSLRSSDSGGNCMNWIIGHIVVTRDALLKAIGEEGLCDENISSLYVKETPFAKDKAADTSILLDLYAKSQEIINKKFSETDFKENPEMSKQLAGFGFHEAYHIGQLGILRRIIGKSGAIK